MMQRFNLYILALILITLSSCNKQPDRLEEVLEAAGENRKELEKVLEYFKHDSLKFKAACFLIENMQNKHSIDWQIYQLYRDTIFKYSNNSAILEESLNKMRGNYIQQTIPDIAIITSKYLIDNIESAFNMYYQVPWHKEISFEYFCEYVLPYRIGNENPEYWRKDAVKFPLDSVNIHSNVLSAAEYIVKALSISTKDFVIRFGDRNPGIIDIPYSVLEKLPVGSCKELGDYATFVARAYSIPCAIDFTPNYANLNSGHTWNVLLLDNERPVPFTIPLEVDTLGRFKSEHYELAKVYRNTYSINPNSHAV